MRRRVLQKLAELVLVLLLVSVSTFMVASLLPGDPAVTVLGPDQPAERYAEVRHALGLEEPLPSRFVDWLGNAVTGDFGNSLIPPGAPVSERILAALPVSLELAVLGLFLSLAIAIPLALASARRPGGRIDRAVTVLTFGVLSTPSFVIGLLLILVVVQQFGLFPRAQWVRLTVDPVGNLVHAALPVLTLALTPLPTFLRVLRADLITTLSEDYIFAARAKGMPGRHILMRDALRPSSFSLLTLAGLSLGHLIGGTVIVETLFSLPGMGNLIVQTAQQQDVKVVQAAVLVIAVIYVLLNTAVDLSLGFLDPRLRRGRL